MTYLFAHNIYKHTHPWQQQHTLKILNQQIIAAMESLVQLYNASSGYKNHIE